MTLPKSLISLALLLVLLVAAGAALASESSDPATSAPAGTEAVASPNVEVTEAAVTDLVPGGALLMGACEDACWAENVACRQQCPHFPPAAFLLCQEECLNALQDCRDAC
jgi:hypothetical protein